MLSNVRLCLRPSLRRDCEVCISGAHGDLETQSHPLIHTKGRGCMNAQMEAGAPSSCRVFLASLSSVVKQNDLEQTVNNEVFNGSCSGACPQVVYRFTVVPREP